MAITKSEIDHLLTIARLDVSEEEEKHLIEQLPQIIEYVGQLQQVNTENIKETSQVTGLTNVTASDKPCISEIEKTLLEQAPSTENNLIKVPKIIS